MGLIESTFDVTITSNLTATKGFVKATGGKFAGIDDSRAMAQANPYVEVFAGIYGAPVIFHPSWIVILTVAS